MKGWRWTLGLGAAVFLLVDFLGYIYEYYEKEIILEFGTFTGSNWDMISTSNSVMVDKAIVKFEEEYLGVRIHYYSGINKEDYSEWCAGELSEGEMPGVFMMPNTDFNLYLSLGVMGELDEPIEHDTGFNRGDFFTTAPDARKYDGHQYVLPYETVPVLLFVNRPLLAKGQTEVPGEDWTRDDMYEICRKITKDVNGDGLLDQFGTYNHSWRNTVYTSGGRLYDGHQQQLPFTSSRVLDTVKYMKCLNGLNQGQSVTQEDFNKGSVAFMPLTFAEYRTYKAYPYRTKKYTEFQRNYITPPTDKERENRFRVGSFLMGINSNTKHEKLTWESLKQLTGNEEMQMDMFRYFRGVSVFKDVTGPAWITAIIQEDMDEGEQVINSSLPYNVVENGVIGPKYQQYEQVMSLADDEISKILMENRNVDSSMEMFQRSTTKYLQQQR